MNVGSLIKDYRTKQGMTQSDLVEGICSVPHLSKIENNGKEGNDQTIDLLLKRLGANLMEVQQKNVLIEKLLDEWINDINYLQVEKARGLYDHLSGLSEFIVYTPHLYLYELYKLRYYLLVRETDKAKIHYKWLEKHKKNFSYQELYLLHYYHAICLIVQNKYRQANEVLDELIVSQGEGVTASGDVYYHLALVKCHIEQPGYAIFYGKQALTSFTADYNLKRMLHTLMIMGISYTDSGIYEVALDCYKHLERNAEILGEMEMLLFTYHNIGYLKQKMGKLKEARDYYKRAMGTSMDDAYSYMVSLYSYAETSFYLEDYPVAKKSFDDLQKEAMQAGVKIYQILPNYYLYMMDGEEEKAIRYLEEYTLPYLYDKELSFTDIRSVNKILADYYKKAGKFKEALQYTYME